MPLEARKKGPPKLGSDRAGKKRVGMSIVAAPRAAGKIQPPRDPYLRAIWKVRQVDELTPTQQLALLALWRLLRNGPKQIGAGLLAALIGVSVSTAKDIFSALQRKGYIKSNGKFRTGRQDRATRELTGKLALPTQRKNKKFRSSTGDQRRSPVRSSGDDPVRSSGDDIDREVRHTRRCCVADATPASESGNRDDNPRPQRTVKIADLLAADAPVKPKAKGGAA